MLRPYWITTVFSCFGPPPTVKVKTAVSVPDKQSGFGSLYKQVHGGILDTFPILWSYLSDAEKKVLRECCRESRRLHDTLAREVYICDNALVFSGVPAARLPRDPLPVCHEPSREVARTLHSFLERGFQPQLLLLCLVEGHERRRHEEGLAILTALANATAKLDVVHVCGVPLTPQSARVLKALLAAEAPVDSPIPRTSKFATVSAPLVPAPPSVASAAMLSTTSSLQSPRTLASISLPPPAAPLRVSLYGYDLARQPAAVAVEVLLGSAAPRLTRLELWGCVGWPKRMSALLHDCRHLHHLSMSFQQLLTGDGGGRGAGDQSSQNAAAAALQRVAASGAVATFPPIAAAATAAAAVKTIGGLHHLRSLELRGCIFNMSRRTSSDVGAARRRSSAASKAAMERAAVAEAAPSVQQLSCALYTLTNLTHLAIDGLNSASPLLTALAAMRGLRQLELPDASAPTVTDLAAIARAAPRLVALTLGSVGPGSVLDAGTNGALAAVTGAPEVLSLPAALAALRIVRYRPTLRTMRSLLRTVEARAAAVTANPAAAVAGPGGGGGPVPSSSPPRMAVVVPGIEIDMLDVEFDALQGFSRGSDGVIRSTLLPDSAEALAAAIRLLAPPPPGTPPSSLPESPVRGSAYSLMGGGGGGSGGVGLGGGPRPSTSDGAPRPSFGDCGRPSFASGCGGAPSSSLGLGCASFGGGYQSSLRGGGGRGRGRGGGAAAAGFDLGGDESHGSPAFGLATTHALVVHNAQGSLCAPAEQGQPQPPAGPGPSLESLPEASDAAPEQPAAAAAVAAALGPGGAVASAGDGIEGAERSRVDGVVQPPPPPAVLVGHAAWISEMRPLELTSLELYGIGVRAGDLQALAELSTLERLTLASGELEVDWLPCLAALPVLGYLELARCTPCRFRHGGGGGCVGARTSTGFVRGSGSVTAGDVFSRASGGAGGGFARGSATAASRESYGSSYDGDGDREARPSGKRALLELCMTAPRLRRVFVVRCTGIVCRAEGMEGPLGAEWVRQRLLAAGPRVRDQKAAAIAGEEATAAAAAASAGHAGLGRKSKAVSSASVAQGAADDYGWPEIQWN